MKFIWLAILVVSSLTARFVHAAPTSRDAASIAQCKELESADFSRVLDAPTQVTESKMVDPSGSDPSYCEVQGYVVPQVGFDLRLPTEAWNGKFIEIGCGGHCGDTVDWALECPLHKGYACIASDDGHRGTWLDGLWGYNNFQAKVDWGYRAPHVTALAGKAITEHYYHKAARKSYFMGCSTGGRQALQEAQRFPWDFDGIIAGAPPVKLSTIYLTFAWGTLATHDRDGKALLSKDDLKLISDAAIGKCDLDDGVKDGIISDPQHCKFDPAELICKGDQTTRCLTRIQVDAVKKVYAGPMTSSGVRLSLGGPMPGSEYGRWNDERGGNWSEAYLGFNGQPAGYAPLLIGGLRYLLFLPELGPSWQLDDFDFDRDYKRMGLMESLYDSSNPDLRTFKAAGGKLIAYQGTNDNAVLPQNTTDYYETVERTMGGQEATRSFFRLFVLPGVEHCGGGDGADSVDYLSALEAWVESGMAPDRLIAAHMKTPSARVFRTFPLDESDVEFTRPAYPYPTKARYRGQGNPNDAASFDPTDH